MQNYGDKVLAVVCYDLAQSPATHDFVNWLVRAEQYRILLEDDDLEVVIVPGDRHRTDRDFYYSAEKKMWRAYTLLIPLARCLPSVSSVRIGTGVQKLHYVNFNEPQKPVLKAPGEASKLMGDFLSGLKNPVSITIRQSEWEEKRNSNIQVWKKVSENLEQMGYSVVWVPDAEALMSGKHEKSWKLECQPASMYPELRLALYERCKMNFMTNSGPFVLALMSFANLSCFKMIVEGIYCCTEKHNRASAFSESDDWGIGKNIYWDDDTLENVMGKIEELSYA